MSQGCNGRACHSGPEDSVLPRLVCCLRGFLDEQPCCRLLIIVMRAEIGGGGCLDGLGERRVSRSCSRRTPAKTASRVMPSMRGLAAMRAPK